MNDKRENRYPTPREFVDEWQAKSDNQRLAAAERIIRDAQMASTCFVMDHTGRIDLLETVHGGLSADARTFRSRAEAAERALADERARVAAARAEADWLNAHHDGSLVTSDYPMIARRIRSALACPAEPDTANDGAP
jgi:hypothetical protein